MKLETAILSDYEYLINLAEEVENLFGSMVDDISFQEALKDAISNELVFCIRSKEAVNSLKGAIIISKELNEIAWLVVSKDARGQGIGRKLLKFAINKLDLKKDIIVQTFDKSVEEGIQARNLYLNFGFVDFKDGGKNPAGIPTVIMKLKIK